MKKLDINYIILFLIAVLLLLPLMNNLYFLGHDTGYHIANIIGFSENLTFKTLFTNKIFPIIGKNFGYGAGIFYPQLAHFLSSLFYKNLAIDVFTSIKILNFIITFASGLSFYKFMKTTTKKKNMALFSTLFYITFPYRMFNIYVRDALSESLTFVFIPLIFLSLYYMLNKEHKKFYISFVIGYVGMIFSHLVMTVYVTIAFLILLLINFKKVWNKDTIKKFFLATFLVFLITAPFTSSLLINKLKGNYVVFVNGEMANNWGVYYNGLTLKDYFMGNKENGYNFINMFAIFICIYYVIKMIRKKISIKETYALLVGISMSLFGIWLSSRAFPWMIMPEFLLMIQFPTRLSLFTAFGVSILVFYSVDSITKHKNKIIVLGVIVCILTSVFCVFNQEYSYLRQEDYDLSELGMGWMYEYLPVKAKENKDYLNSRNNKIIPSNDKINVSILEDTVPFLKFEVETNEKVTLELPRLFYYGYQLRNSNGQIMKYQENEKGFIETTINESGIYELNYTGTNVEKMANIMSIVSSIAFLIYIFLKDRNDSK